MNKTNKFIKLEQIVLYVHALNFMASTLVQHRIEVNNTTIQHKQQEL